MRCFIFLLTMRIRGNSYQKRFESSINNKNQIDDWKHRILIEELQTYIAMMEEENIIEKTIKFVSIYDFQKYVLKKYPLMTNNKTI